jgi:hypothetical protein
MAMYDAIKDAASLALDLKRMELYQELLKVMVEVADLKKENLDLREQVQSLSERLQLKDSLVFEKGIYWVKGDPLTKDQSDTPVCPTCWDKDGKVMRLVVGSYSGGTGIYCKQCKEVFIIEKCESVDEPRLSIVSSTLDLYRH